MKLLEENETVLYQLRKSRMPILFMIFFFPVWLYFASIFLRASYQSVFSGGTVLTPGEYYLAGMIGLIVFIPVVLAIMLSYFFNELIITDQRVYIRKGLSGRTYRLNLSGIRSFQHVISTGTRASNHSILFYLLCGKKIKTGNLFITLNSLQTLLELLREKFEGRGFTSRELADLKLQHPLAEEPVVRTNGLCLLLFLTPWILALVLTINYLSGV
jgi:hypothetical protein